MGPRAFNRVCASIRINRDYAVVSVRINAHGVTKRAWASIRINRDYDVVSVRINAHGVTKRAWAFNCETTVCQLCMCQKYIHHTSIWFRGHLQHTNITSSLNFRAFYTKARRSFDACSE